jgi:hypothetical protein
MSVVGNVRQNVWGFLMGVLRVDSDDAGKRWVEVEERREKMRLTGEAKKSAPGRSAVLSCSCTRQEQRTRAEENENGQERNKSERWTNN